MKMSVFFQFFKFFWVSNQMASSRLRNKDVNITFLLSEFSQNDQNSFPKLPARLVLGPVCLQRAVFPQIVLSAVGIAGAWGG